MTGSHHPALAWLFGRMEGYADRKAVIAGDTATDYAGLVTAADAAAAVLDETGVGRGRVVSLEADFSSSSIAMQLALMDRGAILVPIAGATLQERSKFLEVAEVEVRVIATGRSWDIQSSGRAARHELVRSLVAKGHPGLVLFSSGSTGEHKAALHDFVPLIEKFRVERHAMRTITFLLLDHIGGQNTLLYTLSNGGAVVALHDRDPATVCEAIERHGVQLLPTSPTFLNLLLISEAYRGRDLSSLELITYGTEVMPESTLQRLVEVFPNARFLQTYGLSELGILRSKSRSSDSLWVKVGGEGFEIKVVDGILWVRAQSAMLGYLNHPSPFDAEGWFNTGDRVEVDGEWIRILGRESEIINVGGLKVYPAEVESVILEVPGVADAAVRGEPHPITGNIVVATVSAESGVSSRELRGRIRELCGARLQRYKVPAKIEITTEPLHGQRFKRMRRVPA